MDLDQKPKDHRFSTNQDSGNWLEVMPSYESSGENLALDPKILYCWHERGYLRFDILLGHSQPAH